MLDWDVNVDISCLTTANLPWFVDLTLQVPMQMLYCSLQHQTLLLPPDTSTTEGLFHLTPSVLDGPVQHGSELQWVMQAPLPGQACDPWRGPVYLTHGQWKWRSCVELINEFQNFLSFLNNVSWGGLRLFIVGLKRETMSLFDILDGFLKPISYLVFQWSEPGTWEKEKKKTALNS